MPTYKRAWSDQIAHVARIEKLLNPNAALRPFLADDEEVDMFLNSFPEHFRPAIQMLEFGPPEARTMDNAKDAMSRCAQTYVAPRPKAAQELVAAQAQVPRGTGVCFNFVSKNPCAKRPCPYSHDRVLVQAELARRALALAEHPRTERNLGRRREDRDRPPDERQYREDRAPADRRERRDRDDRPPADKRERLDRTQFCMFCEANRLKCDNHVDSECHHRKKAQAAADAKARAPAPLGG
jgi:hypothetical protein